MKLHQNVKIGNMNVAILNINANLKSVSGNTLANIIRMRRL